MTKFRALALAAAGLVALSAANANAATFVCGASAQCSFTEADGTGAFTDRVLSPGFSDIFKVVLSTAGEIIVTLTATPLGVSFSSLTFDGSPFTVGTTGTSFLVGPGTYDLALTGTTTRTATYAGTIDFIPAIPEPATWGLMLAGFAAVGFAMRRRQNVRVSFA